MQWYEVIGYVGSLLMFSTFYMKTMIPLRVVGIAANVAMIAYTSLKHVYPILVLQTCLLPLNVVRLVQMRRLIARGLHSAQADFKLDALMPFMHRERHASGHVLFRRDDRSDKLYLIVAGKVRIEELGRVVGPGELLGEIGILSATNTRTATAVCETDVELLSLTESMVLQLHYQDPRFGLFLVRLVIQRLLSQRDREPPLPVDAPSVA